MFSLDMCRKILFIKMWSKERMTRLGEGDGNLVLGWRPRLVVLFQILRSRWRPRHRAVAMVTTTRVCGEDDDDLGMGLRHRRRQP
jgi:hypothetical protein